MRVLEHYTVRHAGVRRATRIARRRSGGTVARGTVRERATLSVVVHACAPLREW